MRVLLSWGLLLIAVSLTAGVTVVSQDANHVVIQYQWDDATLTPVDNYQAIEAPGLAHEETVGMTDLPWCIQNVGVPADGRITVRVTHEESRNLKLDRPLAPVPQIIKNGLTDSSIYTTSPQLPDARPRVEVLDAFTYREMNVIPVRVNPFELEGRTLKIHDLTLEITIQGTTDRNYTASSELDKYYQALLCNYNTAKNWRTQTRARNVNYAHFEDYPVWASCEVPKDGIYRLTYDDLASIFPIADVDPTLLRVFSSGGAVMSTAVGYNGPSFAEIPIYVSGGDDHSFDPGDYILFYGQDRDGYGMNNVIDSDQYYNPYSQDGVYWITYGVGTSDPFRIPETAVTGNATVYTNHPETIHYEQEAVKFTDLNYEWFTEEYAYTGSSITTNTYRLTLTDPTPNGTKTLKLVMMPDDDGIYSHVDASLNSTLVMDNKTVYCSNGTYNVALTATTTAGTAGSNTLKIQLDRSSAINIYFDYYELTYPQDLYKYSVQKTVNPWSAGSSTPAEWDFASGYSSTLLAFEIGEYNIAYRRPIVADGTGFHFDSGNIGRCIVLEPSEAYSVTNLQAREPVDLVQNASDLQAVIVAPTGFMDSARELSTIYSNDLHIVARAVDQQDIFDRFSGGMPDPNAIRLYMKYLDASGCPLEYLTLIGSGTLDWRNFNGSATGKNQLILYEAGSDRIYAPCDEFFAHLSQNRYPELAVGRYPVQTQAQLDVMLQHVQDYLDNQQIGWWKNRMVFLADDEHQSSSIDGINHTNSMQDHAELVSRACYVDKIFSTDYDMDEYHNKPLVRDLMISKINDGALLWYYNGHGGPDVLGDERYFMLTDLPKLTNSDHLPLFIAASCSVGEFDTFAIDCLGERIVSQSNGGAIASITASRSTSGGNNTTFFEHFFPMLINNRNAGGVALALAKAEDTNTEKQCYNFFGDPTLVILPPEPVAGLTLDGSNTVAGMQDVSGHGDFGSLAGTGSAEVYAWDPEEKYTKTLSTGLTYNYSNSGRTMYRGSVSVTNGTFASKFVVPYDAENGTNGRIVAYYNDGQRDAICYLSPLTVSGYVNTPANPDTPTISTWLGTKDFRSGDPVSSTAKLIVDIADSNGVNILGLPGHRILTRLDDNTDMTDITDQFEYDLDSHLHGEIQYQMEGLEKGTHQLQVIALDNLNTPAIATTDFRVVSSASATNVKLEDVLPYPSPWNGKGKFYFTFILTEDANVTISVYTITGKKIRTLHANGLGTGYHQVEWDGLDSDGDALANNTYFFKVKANMLNGKSSDEKTEKMVIYR